MEENLVKRVSLYDETKVREIYTDGIPKGADVFNLRIGSIKKIYDAKRQILRAHFPENYLSKERKLILPVWFSIEPGYLEWEVSVDGLMGVQNYDRNAELIRLKETPAEFMHNIQNRKNFAGMIAMDELAKTIFQGHQAQFKSFNKEYFEAGRGIAILAKY